VFGKFVLSTLLFVTVAFATSVPATASAQNMGQGGPFGLGILIGDPTAITFKYDLDSIRSINGGLSFDLNRWTLIYVDGIYHYPNAFGRPNPFVAQLTPYLGVGGLIVISNRSEFERRRDRYFNDERDGSLALGMRIPLGIEWRPPAFPIGVFLELAPGLTIIPGTYGFVQGGLGARFFF
jgi:hypothetical protein